MKKLIMTSLLASAVLVNVSAQWAGTNPITTNANVQIGAKAVGSYKLTFPGFYNFEQLTLGQMGNGNCGIEFVNHSTATESYGVKLLTNIDTGVDGFQIQTANKSTIYPLTYTTKMTVKVDGNVGIGTTTPAAKLDVNGTFKVAGASTLSSTLGVTGATTLSNTLMVAGLSTLGSLKVTGASTLAATTIVGATNITGAVNLAGATSNLSVGGTLGVTGATTLSSLKVNGLATVGGFKVYQTDNPCLTVESSYSSATLGAASCDGCYSNFAQRGDIVLRAMGNAKHILFNIPNLPNDANGYVGFTDEINGTWCKFKNNKEVTIDGNVGIGTTTPEATLHVNGTTRFDNDVTIYTPKTGNGTASTWAISNNTPSHGAPGSGLQFWRTATLPTGIFQLCTMHLGDNGYVGIGTTEPDYMLTVNGTIHAKEVKIDLKGPLADYVFDKNYKLMDLKDVESYVNEHSHLPEVPSASEVATNGMDLGEMQNKMLQKIEELTLYVIKQQKEIDELKKK
jgi:hypothetical protein